MDLSRMPISSADNTDVFPFLTPCLGPRTECAGLSGMTWPVTSQSKHPDGGEVLLDSRLGMFRQQKLDVSGDGAVEACVAGFVHFAHTSSSDRGQDLVRAEFIACCQGHLVESVQFIRSGGGQVLGHGLNGS